MRIKIVCKLNIKTEELSIDYLIDIGLIHFLKNN